MQSIFFGSPVIDGDQVIYITPDIGGDYYIGEISSGSGNTKSTTTFTFSTMFCTTNQRLRIKVSEVYEDYGAFGYLWSIDDGNSYNGATKLETPVQIETPFIGAVGSTTYDQPALVTLDKGDFIAFAQKQTDANGKQIVCRVFDYDNWTWNSEVVVASATDTQSYPSGYLLDGDHIAVGFIDDSDASNRKVRLYQSRDLLGLTWEKFCEFSTSSQIYNLCLCKINDIVVAAYDDATDALCRLSLSNGYHFFAESEEITIKASATDPFVINNGGNSFMAFVIEGGTPSVKGHLSQFGQSWAEVNTSDNPEIAGDALTDTMSLPTAFSDDNGDLICIARSDQGKTYMTKSSDRGRTWADINDSQDDIIPDSNGLAVCDTGGLTPILTRGLGSAKSIAALAGRVYTKDIFLQTPLDIDYLAVNGKPDDLGWTLDGTDESSMDDDARKIATGTTEQCYYRKAFGPTITNGFVDVFRMKVTSGGGNDQSCIRRYDVNNSISFCLAFSTTGVVLKDLQATSDLATDTHDYTAVHDFMVSVKKTGSNVGYCIKRKEGSDPWNGTWTTIAEGSADGYLGEGGARTTQTGFGDNSTVNGENSTSYWYSIFTQDDDDDDLSSATVTSIGKRMGGYRMGMHYLTNNLGIGATSAGGDAINNEYTCTVMSNLTYSNLFGGHIDSPLYSKEDNIDWKFICDCEVHDTNDMYHANMIAFKGGNVRKVKIYGTNTGIADAWTDDHGKTWSVGSFPDIATFSLIGEIDSYIGETGTISAIGECYLTVSGKSWIPNQYKDYLCELDDGAGTVKIYKVFQNTADTLIFSGASLVTDGFETSDTMSLCSGGAARKVSAYSYRWIMIEVEPVYTQDELYKLPYVCFDGFRYEPNTVFYNPIVDDDTLREWVPNIDMYLGKSGFRRTQKLGNTRKERTLFFIESDKDIASHLTQLEKYLEHLNFHQTPIIYIEDDTIVQSGNYWDLRLGRLMGGFRMSHKIQGKYEIEPLLFSEEV